MQGTITNYDIVDIMCYLFDSYLGLGHQYLLSDEYIINWEVEYNNRMQLNGYYLECHNLIVNYGERHLITPGSGHGGN